MPDSLAMSTSSTSKITAQLVSVWRDEALTGAALAENADSSGWNLIFQRARRFDEQDRSLGIDTYCLSNARFGPHWGHFSVPHGVQSRSNGSHR